MASCSSSGGFEGGLTLSAAGRAGQASLEGSAVSEWCVSRSSCSDLHCSKTAASEAGNTGIAAVVSRASQAHDGSFCFRAW